jgi:predicted nucleic acid-binding protein
VEVHSALARREREGDLPRPGLTRAVAVLRSLESSWSEVVASDPVRRAALRLLRLHPLRAADALQLAAAVVAAEHDPAALELVCLDERLSAAASREGFQVLPEEA